MQQVAAASSCLHKTEGFQGVLEVKVKVKVLVTLWNLQLQHAVVWLAAVWMGHEAAKLAL